MPSKKKANDDFLAYYSHLLIDKTKRAGFFFIYIPFYALITLTIAQHLMGSRSYTLIVIPIVLFGLPIIFYPPIERWVYKPWQTKPQKYERHYRE